MKTSLRGHFLVGCLIAALAGGAVAEEEPRLSIVPVAAGLETDVSSALEAVPAVIRLRGRDARWQLQVSAHSSSSGETRDVTRVVDYQIQPADVLTIDETGFVKPLADGTASVICQLPEHGSAEIQVEVTGMQRNEAVNFPNQVVPIFTKLGCNGGGCHGKASGQAGFKLSLLGFEPEEDYQHLINESRGRRIFPAMPERSLLLEKAINAVPHGGGKRTDAESHEYRIIRRWIAGGMPYGKPDDPVLEEIAIRPQQRRLLRGSQQQLSVIARYSDGHVEDITRTAQFESNNGDLAEVTSQGLVTLGDRSGNVSVMARYQGQVAVFQASIPLGVEVDHWPVERNLVDRFVFSKLKTLGIPPSDECDDSTFIRRVTLDLTGRLPTVRETRTFLASDASDKHERLVDRLLESDDYAEWFAKKWTAILRNRRPNPGYQFGSYAFHNWLRDSFHHNKPYDQLVRELLTASGSLRANPPVAWLREVSTTEERVEDAAQLFLGQRLQCARCHHHPFEKWSQQDYYQMAAFFSKVSRKEGPTPDEPRFVSRVGRASAKHPKTGETLPAVGLDGQPIDIMPVEDPREKLVDWMVAPENPFFAKSLANRYWKHFFLTGLVEPEDDMRVTNPPSNPELLNGLADYFVEQDFDLKQLIRLLCTSTAYRLDSVANEHNLGDHNSYSRYYPKRMTAEVLLDAVDQVTWNKTQFQGMPRTTRAVSLPDTSFGSYFLDVFGKPDSSTACECERNQQATLAQSLHLLNSKEILGKLSAEQGRAAAMAVSSESLEQKVEQLYLAAFSRLPNSTELDTAREYIQARSEQPQQAYEDLLWAIVNSKEFVFNH